MKVLKMITLAAAGVLVSTGSAAAQAYFGTPIGDAGFAVRAEVGFPEDSKTYDVVLDANLLGPISFQLFGGLIDIDDFDDNGARFGGRLGYELPMAALSIGPFVGAEYNTVSADVTGGEYKETLLVVPVGLGLGASLPVGPAGDVVVYAQPAYMYMKFDVESPVLNFDESENEFGVDAGAKLGISRFVVGGSVRWTSVEDSDPVFAVTAGLRF